MISTRKWPSLSLKITAFTSILAVTLLIVDFYGISLRKDKLEFPVNTACRGNVIVEATYDNQRAKMKSSLYFSFLDSKKILISLSGTAYLYDEKNKVVERKTILRNIYFDYVRESKATDTYSLISTQINIDSIDNMDWKMSSLLLMNSFFLSGHTDTLVLKKYDEKTMLIESNQSPIAICVFKNEL